METQEEIVSELKRVEQFTKSYACYCKGCESKCNTLKQTFFNHKPLKLFGISKMNVLWNVLTQNILSAN